MAKKWRLARSLVQLRAQINALAPHRSTKSDGTIGDPRHASQQSDHNPVNGVVHALDVTNDPANGMDGWELAMALMRSRDRRIGYVISRGKIIAGQNGPQPWVVREYHGSNRHDSHTHISVRGDNGDDPAPWVLAMQGSNILLKRGDSGPAVERMQLLLIADGAKIKPDKEFGPKTEAALIEFQKAHGLLADGICGPRTWAALLK